MNHASTSNDSAGTKFGPYARDLLEAASGPSGNHRILCDGDGRPVATTSSRIEAVEIQMKSEPAEILLSSQYLRHRLPVVQVPTLR